MTQFEQFSKPNYYERLDVSENATNEEIIKAFRKAGRNCHPDKFPNNRQEAELAFKNLVEARDTLANPTSRKEYDEYLNLARRRQRTRQPQQNASRPQRNNGNPQAQQRTGGFTPPKVSEERFNELLRELAEDIVTNGEEPIVPLALLSAAVGIFSCFTDNPSMRRAGFYASLATGLASVNRLTPENNRRALQLTFATLEIDDTI